MHSWSFRFSSFSLASFSAAIAYAAPELPVITWDPGLPGGIPSITQPVASVLDHGAAADGVTDDLGAFEDALAELSEGGVLLVPAGEYLIEGTLEIATDGVVVRGEGADRSHLLLGTAETASLSVLTYGRGDWQTLEEAARRGEHSITVPDGAAFSVGQWAELEMANDPALMYTDPAWEVDWAENARGQLFEVTAIDGNVISFRHPLYLDYPLTDAPRVRPQRFVQHVGIESLSLERVIDDSDASVVLWKNAAYVWMREVESRQTRRSHLDTDTVLGCQVENSYLHDSYDHGGGGHGYGTSLGFHTTDCLVENNLFRSLRHSMIIQSGASGNVFGYNHSKDVVQTEGSVPNEGWLPPDISVHGHWSNNNLFEANTVEQIGIADYWGPTGPHMLYFRNRVVNDEFRSDGQTEEAAITLDDHSNYQYILGNRIENGSLETDGTPDMTTNVIHGHQESGEVSWNEAIADHELLASYYWGCKPNFLDEAPWPLIGPDVAESGTLPAGERLDSGSFFAPSYDRACEDGSPNPGVEGADLGAGGAAEPPGPEGGTASAGKPSSEGGADGAAEPPPAGSADDGCGCRVSGRRSAGEIWTLWLALGAALCGLRRAARR